MSESISNGCVATVPNGVGDAVGVERAQWRIAIVNHNTEKACALKLQQLGYDAFAATQKDLRIWRNGRRQIIDKVIIHNIIFIRSTEEQRRSILRLPYIFRFMTNRASGHEMASERVAVIPATEIARLRFMLGNAENPIDFINKPLKRGDKIRVVRGGLRGLEGEVITAPDGSKQLVVRIDILGCAMVTIDPLDVHPVK